MKKLMTQSVHSVLAISYKINPSYFYWGLSFKGISNHQIPKLF